MNVVSTVHLIASALVGVGTLVALVAYRVRRRWLYAAAKATASAGFVAAAVFAGALDATWSTVALAALALSAVGDVLLAGAGSRWFLGGLGAFALAHATYSRAFLVRGVSFAAIGPSALLGAAVAVMAWRWLGPHVDGRLRLPVAAYMAIIGVLIGTGLASAIRASDPLIGAGVVLVALSDFAVGRERFVAKSFHNKLWGLPAYYVGQLLIAVRLGG